MRQGDVGAVELVTLETGSLGLNPDSAVSLCDLGQENPSLHALGPCLRSRRVTVPTRGVDRWLLGDTSEKQACHRGYVI